MGSAAAGSPYGRQVCCSPFIHECVCACVSLVTVSPQVWSSSHEQDSFEYASYVCRHLSTCPHVLPRTERVYRHHVPVSTHTHEIRSEKETRAGGVTGMKGHNSGSDVQQQIFREDLRESKPIARTQHWSGRGKRQSSVLNACFPRVLLT